MSGDEFFALIASLLLGVTGWKNWIGGVLMISNGFQKSGRGRLSMVFPASAAGSILFVLLSWSAHDVRSDLAYIVFYFVMWFGWTGMLLRALPFLGLNARDDMLERRNPAAGLAVGGALLGGTFAFAGGNIGDGPGWWVVVFSAALANGAQLLLWVIGNRFSRVDEAITIDRDVSAGWRALGFFIGCGLIVGRAVAGNWHSWVETTRDFAVRGWPALILWGMAVMMDGVLRPSPSRPTRQAFACGVVPAVLLVAIGLVVVFLQGAW